MNTQVLRLYIAGSSAPSRRAVQDVERLRTHAAARWELRVIDVLEQPELAEQAGIFATPTLSYDDSSSPRRLVGEFSDPAQVLTMLGIT